MSAGTTAKQAVVCQNDCMLWQLRMSFQLQGLTKYFTSYGNLAL